MRALLVFFVLVTALYFLVCLQGSDPVPVGEECVAPSIWFQPSGTPEPDYTKKLDPKNDCDFYGFAWQTFLFVTGTNKDETQPRFLSFATPEEVFGKYSSLAFPDRLKKDDLVLSPRVAKPFGSRDLDTIFQAGENGVVVDQNGRAIYYGLHMNDRFVKFVRDNKLITPEGIAAADKTLMFEPGCLEFKSSWRIVSDKEEPSMFFTRMARLPTLVKKDDKIFVDTKNVRTEKVALVGLHVVGVPKDHPEFVWATFEHISNAPDLPITLANLDRANPLWKTTTVAEEQWTFCAKDTKADKCNILNKQDGPNPVHFVNEKMQTLAPITQVLRHYPFGGDNPRGILSLNASVHEKLPKGDFRRNFEMIGAVWLDNPVGKDGTFLEDRTFEDDVLAGAKRLSSSTMETFTQNTQFEQNCFGCHNTKTMEVKVQGGPSIFLDPKRINVSHMIVRAYSQGMQQQALNKKKEK